MKILLLAIIYTRVLINLIDTLIINIEYYIRLYKIKLYRYLIKNFGV